MQDLCRIDQIVPDRYRTASYVDLSTSILARIQKLEMSQGILFWGTPGTGKSHALSAILNERFYGGHDVARETYEMLCLKIRDTYKSGSKLTELHVINPLIEVETLVIEDVGTTVSVGEQESDFSLRTFLVLLDKRLEWCRPTFISTNKSVEELGKSFDIRVASRLQEACDIIELSGTDRRKQKKLLTANQEAK